MNELKKISSSELEEAVRTSGIEEQKKLDEAAEIFNKAIEEYEKKENKENKEKGEERE